jgi:SlyX protein
MKAAVPPGADAGNAAVDNRLDALEVKLAFVDDLVETLNRTVFRQQQQIDQLLQAVVALRQQVRSSGPALASDPRDEIPPHY